MGLKECLFAGYYTCGAGAESNMKAMKGGSVRRWRMAGRQAVLLNGDEVVGRAWAVERWWKCCATCLDDELKVLTCS